MNSKSFTLIGLMTVVAIVAISSGITSIDYNLFIKQGKIAKSMAFDSSIHSNLHHAIVGDWKMDDNATNSTVVDTSGNNNDGTLYTGAYIDTIGGGFTCDEAYTVHHSVDGPNNTALEFFGNSYVRAPDSDSLDITDEITMSAWIYPHIYTNHGTVATKVGAYYFQVHSDGRVAVCTYYKKDDTSCGNSSHFTHSNSTVPLDAWTHIVFVEDPDGTRHIYINGTEDTTDSAEPSIWSSNSYLGIGGQHYLSHIFKGSIDQVRIYGEAFSISQAKYQYYTGLQKLYDKGLMSGKEYKSRIVTLNSES